MKERIRWVTVVVPARDEEELLPGCLEALSVSAARVPVPVRIIVVLDSCNDGSAAACHGFPVDTVCIQAGNVGVARAFGIARALAGETDLCHVWVASTDADTRVAADWLESHIRLADEGADVVLGVVDLDTDGPDRIRQLHQHRYASQIGFDGSHTHVHGANLGVRGSSYLQSGGFPPLPEHEDHQLILRLQASPDITVAQSDRVRVITSARTRGRCHIGFAADLAELGQGGPPA